MFGVYLFMSDIEYIIDILFYLYFFSMHVVW